MSAIGPGDFVEALISEKGNWGLQDIVKGQLYQVRQFAGGPAEEGHGCPTCGNTAPALVLVGDRPVIAGWGWCSCVFRPVYRPNADLIASLLAPAPSVPAEPVPA